MLQTGPRIGLVPGCMWTLSPRYPTMLKDSMFSEYRVYSHIS
jgi:hypothetical protein